MPPTPELKDLLSELHSEVVAKLLAKVQSGQAEPADIRNALQLLKQNKIECLPTANKNMAELITRMGLPDFDKQANQEFDA